MIYDVYVDLFFFINFSMDYICLYITAKILRHKISTPRFVIASALGGAYSVVSLFLSLGPFPSFLLDCAACFLLITVCFYKKGTKKLRLFPAALLFVGVSMLLGGVMTAIFNLLNKLDLDLDILYSDGAHTYVFAIIAVVSAAISDWRVLPPISPVWHRSPVWPSPVATAKAMPVTSAVLTTKP